jgi:hypothetical protein
MVDDPHTLEAVTFVLAPVDWGGQVAVAEHTPAEEGQGNLLAKEDMADAGRYIGEGVPDAADDEIFEWGCSSDEGRASGLRD